MELYQNYEVFTEYIHNTCIYTDIHSSMSFHIPSEAMTLHYYVKHYEISVILVIVLILYDAELSSRVQNMRAA